MKTLKDNAETISQQEIYKNSQEYQNSMIKQIQNNKYYEIAILLIRTYSKSYDEYYKKLLKVNKQYLNIKNQL